MVKSDKLIITDWIYWISSEQIGKSKIKFNSFWKPEAISMKDGATSTPTQENTSSVHIAEEENGLV